jgi:hypothetical protein
MTILGAVFERLFSAMLMAVSVALLAAGLLSWSAPPGFETSTPEPSDVAGDPILGTDTPPVAPSSPPAASPVASATPPASATASPPPGASTSPPASPASSLPPIVPPSPVDGAPASRIVIPSLNVDLAVMSGEAQVRGNRDNYPLCDVAQYLTYYVDPGEAGTVYIYAHAQRGMFLPLLRASQRDDGAEMVGALVEVYTSDNRLHLYEIFRVKRHARDFALANNLEPGEHRLVLQTSEGRTGHIPKLQVAARPIAVLPADPADANPEPNPRPCWPR